MRVRLLVVSMGKKGFYDGGFSWFLVNFGF